MKTRYTADKGVVSTNNDQGFSIEKNSANYGFSPYKVDSTTAKTADATLVAGDAGVLTISGTAAKTMTMPSSSLCPGSMWTFTNLSEGKQHALTSSAGWSSGLTATAFQDGTSAGSKLTLSGAIGTTVTLISNGRSYIVLGSSLSGAAGQGPAYSLSGT
jgi:hypothetical protein